MKEKIKLGYVGLGRRGYGVLEGCMAEMKDIEFTIFCDTDIEKMEKGWELLKENGHTKKPIMTTDYQDVVNNPEIDAIILMTGWHNRAEMAAQSMRAGKYTGIEVGCAFDLDECYMLAEVYEETKTPLMMLENICYGRREMMALNLHEQGLFGEVVHCVGGYHHYLPKVELFLDVDDKELKHYRLHSYINRNCEQYPTHELGPISKLLKLNRGNRMLTLSSFASKSRGLKDYATRNFGEDDIRAKLDYKQGDIVDTMIKCANGETIHLTLDTTIPRPYYSRNFTVRGTHGMYTEERKVLFLEGMEEKIENNEDEMFKIYDHPLHKEFSQYDSRAGHGGCDWLVSRAFIESVKAGTDTPIDAYDTILWMSIAALSEMSIERGGAPVHVPDFTKGKWMTKRPIAEGKYCLDKVCVDESIKIY